MAGVDWQLVAIIIGVLVPSVILHEVAHGALALVFGDDTAKQAGRLTLNPVRHIDPFGTVLLPAMLALSGLGAFGYAKPVPVRPNRLRDPRRHSLYVSLVGPAVNIVLAILAVLVWRAMYGSIDSPRAVPSGLVPEVVLWFGVINVILAVFNLIPLPPLDGSAVIERVLPARLWPAWLRLRRWSILLILVVVLAVPGALARLFGWAIDLWLVLL